MRWLGFALTLAVVWLLAKNLFSAPKPITLSVQPQVAVVSQYQTTTFRVRITIPQNKDNLLVRYSASCGSEIKSSERTVESVTWTFFEELTVNDNCIFQACLFRREKDKTRNYCDYAEVTTED